MDVAIASLEQVDNHLRDGVEDGLFAPRPAAEAVRLCARGRWMSVRLRVYLPAEAARKTRRKPRQRDE